MIDTTITPETRRMFVEDANSILAHDKNLERRAAAEAILRLLNALEAAEARIRQLAYDGLDGSLDYLALMDRYDNAIIRAEQAEGESANLRERVGALLELNDVGMEILDASLAEAEAISAHDDYRTGRNLGTETRLKDVRARLFAVYAKGTKVREKCEALGLNVTPCQQGAHDA